MAGRPLQPILVEHGLGCRRLPKPKQHRHTHAEKTKELGGRIDRQIWRLKQRREREEAVRQVFDDERRHPDQRAHRAEANPCCRPAAATREREIHHRGQHVDDGQQMGPESQTDQDAP